MAWVAIGYWLTLRIREKKLGAAGLPWVLSMWTEGAGMAKDKVAERDCVPL